MKQMRSRFRLLTLLLVCAFFLTAVICAGAVLKTAGVSLDSLPRLPFPGGTASPGPSLTPDGPEAGETLSPPPSAGPEETPLPGTDNPPETQYNIYGL